MGKEIKYIIVAEEPKKQDDDMAAVLLAMILMIILGMFMDEQKAKQVVDETKFKLLGKG